MAIFRKRRLVSLIFLLHSYLQILCCGFRPQHTGRLPFSLLHSRQSIDDARQQSSEGPIPFQYLGKGTGAIVKIGCVLVAPSYEFNHYYRKSAIFIYGMGTSTKDDSGDYLIRGVILDHCTPFTLTEMMADNENLVDNPLGHNLLFRGGDKGKEGDVILLHSHAELGQSSIGDGDEATGVFQGGWDAVLEACADGKIEPESCKVFFNYVEFTEQELDNMLEDVEDGDAWMSLMVQPDIILHQWPDRGDAWSRLRNAVTQSKLKP